MLVHTQYNIPFMNGVSCLMLRAFPANNTDFIHFEFRIFVSSLFQGRYFNLKYNFMVLQLFVCFQLQTCEFRLSKIHLSFSFTYFSKVLWDVIF